MAGVACVGCGAVFENHDGPTHRYIESSPGCWAVYGEVLAREYSDPTYGSVHRFTVDAYAVQHPGRPSPQSIQSVALHLMSLCLVLERGVGPDGATAFLQSAARDKGRWVWLTPPESRGSVTVQNVHGAASGAEHRMLVREWAGSVWTAWSVHHPAVHAWLRAGQESR